jgi:REP element-mobilizing transposase RayT
LRRSLGALIRTFKAATTRRINEHRRTPGAPVWQRNYYERVIRDEAELARVRQYILDNPAKWAEDKHNPANLPRVGAVRIRA